MTQYAANESFTTRSNALKTGEGPQDDGPRLLEQVRNAIRLKHYSIRTERSYIDWIKRYIYFHGKQHPRNLNETHISQFLTYLAVNQKVVSSTQNRPYVPWCFYIVRF